MNLFAPILLSVCLLGCSASEMDDFVDPDKSDEANKELVQLAINPSNAQYICADGMEDVVCNNNFAEQEADRGYRIGIPSTFLTTTGVTDYVSETGWLAAIVKENHILAGTERITIQNPTGTGLLDGQNIYGFRLRYRIHETQEWSLVGSKSTFFASATIDPQAGTVDGVSTRNECFEGPCDWRTAPTETLNIEAFPGGTLMDYQVLAVPLTNPGDFDLGDYDIAIDVTLAQ